MSIDITDEITDLLLAWNDGEQAALEKLVPLVEVELRRLARSYMRRERTGHTLQTTALINEVYLRLINARRVSWHNRAHFFGIGPYHLLKFIGELAQASHAPNDELQTFLPSLSYTVGIGSR